MPLKFKDPEVPHLQQSLQNSHYDKNIEFEHKDFNALKIRNFKLNLPKIESHKAEVIWNRRTKRFLKEKKQNCQEKKSKPRSD